MRFEVDIPAHSSVISVPKLIDDVIQTRTLFGRRENLIFSSGKRYSCLCKLWFCLKNSLQGLSKPAKRSTIPVSP